MEKLRIVFMGTPEFAVGILDTIYQNNYDIAGVITAPDRPAGRGRKVQYSAVKEYAVEKGFKILQPVNLKDETFLNELKTLNANVQVVVAFRMLPEAVWKMPKLGTFNLHASLLPEYRGAAPINWAVINGEKVTGVTTFFIDDKIDTGAIIAKEQTPIAANETAGELHDRLKDMGSMLVLKTLHLIESGKAETSEQPQAETGKAAPKLSKDNTKIEWSKPGREIYNLIRGLSPYPAAWCIIKDGENEWNTKIYHSEFEEIMHNEMPGNIISDKKNIRITVQDGFLNIKELQLPGKKRMKAAELLNGMVFSENTKAL